MPKKFSVVFVLFLLVLEMSAQQAHINLDWAPQRAGGTLIPFMANTISPEVSDDHMVTFRLKAPQAKEVFVSGTVMRGMKSQDPIKLTKGEDGLWSGTVGPVTPEIYKYNFIVDGVRIVDPANTYVGFANQPDYSVLVVHGDGPAWYDAKDVPHGSITRHIYQSDVTNGQREMYVYTPPGYDNSKKYPVLYLFGGSGEVASTWMLTGRVNFIMDNMIADGTAVPMIIAMPNNQVVHRMDPKHTEISFPKFNDEMLQEVIPFIEANYSVKADKHNRAISGLSMGGRHAQIIGLNNLDVFGSIGILSAAESLDLIKPSVLDDPKINEKIDYLFVGAGTNETTPESRQTLMHQTFEEKNIEHEFYVGSAGAHDFITWKHLLYYKFLPKLWQE
ncbi:alpha/beta hydrolase-fold protein [Draconibacterium sp. IB214405]|uniref:alpha/beta hydrolase-fold protein n=1 Tax=Draconibacterium sp. IB214405 TaxID=3097352 RepID=UPI002A126208|nr:alpha/beta hydrolase-fold protein [Draconibacterium sp. IB214405]MDX8338948.1 alpha/beta hydrolase-fold protein [Draconibacterium sp. IB214405]